MGIKPRSLGMTTEVEGGATKMYPIAECFTSPQGEGVYAGQMQTFIRLAGCTVGKRYPAVEYQKTSPGVGTLPIYTEECTLYDGRKFACDTDYRSHVRYNAHQLVAKIPSGVDNVCITGGEPLMHDLSTLIMYIFGVGRIVHIETSGTIFRPLNSDIWVTVSPKKGILPSMLRRANELKILVDEKFNPEEPIETDEGSYYLATLAESKPVFLQPVNFEKSINPKNLRLCMDWQKKFPGLRVCLQLHKAMSVYLNEEVR